MALSCAGFLERLEELADSTLAPDARGAVERHLASCASCREIAARFTGPLGPREEAGPAPDLAANVLQRTSGSACERLRASLCEHADGRLERTDALLVECHLETCPACSGLARTLHRLGRDVPRLAEIDPGVRFLSDVLAATTGARGTFAGRRWAEAWQRLWSRPRLALEGAFVGSLVFALVFGAPTAPLADTGRQALDLVRGTSDELAARAEVLGEAARDGLVSSGRGAAGRAERAWAFAADRFATGFGTLRDRFASSLMGSQTPDPAQDAGTGRGDAR